MHGERKNIRFAVKIGVGIGIAIGIESDIQVPGTGYRVPGAGAGFAGRH
jgi:hypothetical protein